MESQKSYEMPLIKLSALKKTVCDYEMCFRSDRCNPPEDSFEFRTVDFDQLLNPKDPTFAEEVGLTFFTGGEEGLPYLPTAWSRAQLLRHLGTREKWFSTVPLAAQVTELNRRRHTFEGQVFKRMKDPVTPDSPLRVLRGLVSQHYQNIPNTLVMQVLEQSTDESQEVASLWSGISDRAFYASVVVAAPLTVDFAGFVMHPGAIIRNSEVGYTSLWLQPALYLPQMRVMVPVKHLGTYRRAHRGKHVEIIEEFKTALGALSTLWAPIAEKMTKLEHYTLPSEDAALDLILSALSTAPRHLMFRIQQIYKKQHYTAHNAARVLTAALEGCQDQVASLDQRYERGALAGALLLRLIRLCP